MLVAKIDELVAMTTRDLDEMRGVTDQLEPERAQSCGIAISLCRAELKEASEHRGERHKQLTAAIGAARKALV